MDEKVVRYRQRIKDANIAYIKRFVHQNVPDFQIIMYVMQKTK